MAEDDREVVGADVGYVLPDRDRVPEQPVGRGERRTYPAYLGATFIISAPYGLPVSSFIVRAGDDRIGAVVRAQRGWSSCSFPVPLRRQHRARTMQAM